jgi:hypothetical protein
MSLSGPTDAGALRQGALAYAERGWQVLPLWWPASTGDCACGLPDCDSVGKHPIRRLVPHGLHDASCRLATVAEWWGSFPRANVGIRTGAQSGLVVIDVDGQPGRLALHGLVASHGRFHGWWVRTGGGWHAYLAHPGTPVPNSAGRLGLGLDVRGDGGYVVAPPSLHSRRRRYRWIGLQDVGDLPPMPGWLVELACPPAPIGSQPAPVWLRRADAPAYAAAVVEREASEVAHALPGQRNHQLNRAAFKLGQLVGAGLLEERTAATALVAAGLAAGPGERKIRATVDRGLQAGKRRPRSVVLRSAT